METWKEIKNYENLYEVSTLGNVRRKKGYQAKKDRILKAINNGHNYLCVCLSKESIVKRYYIHRLVAETFIDNPDNKAEVNHRDGNTLNNKSNNLEWVTRSENHLHRYKILKRPATNKGKFGILNWNSKKVGMYNKENILIETFPAVMEAARKLGCSDSSIRSVIYGKAKTCKGFIFKYE